MSQQAGIRDFVSSPQRGGLPAGIKRADVALDSHVWDGFFKEAVNWQALKNPAAKAVASSKKLFSGIAGKIKSLATSSGKGVTTHLGTSGTSAVPSPSPRPVIPS